MKIISVVSSALLMFAALSAPVVAQRSGNTQAVRRFVQSFYNWYMSAGSREDRALQSRSSDFTVQLLRGLREDAAASAKSPGEIVGLDFDPFLNSQDPDDHYRVGKATQKGADFFVEVRGVVHGKLEAKPSVVAKVVTLNGRYRFANFIYPDNGGDLLSILRSLKAERAKPHSGRLQEN